MAIEDAAALAHAFQLVNTQDEVAESLAVWEKVRLKRTSQMQYASLLNGKLWHFADGLEQEARDVGMRAELLIVIYTVPGHIGKDLCSRFVIIRQRRIQLIMSRQTVHREHMISGIRCELLLRHYEKSEWVLWPSVPNLCVMGHGERCTVRHCPPKDRSVDPRIFVRCEVCEIHNGLHTHALATTVQRYLTRVR